MQNKKIKGTALRVTISLSIIVLCILTIAFLIHYAANDKDNILESNENVSCSDIATKFDVGAYSAQHEVYGQLYLGDSKKPETLQNIPNDYYTNTTWYVGYSVPEGYGFNMVQTNNSPDFNPDTGWETTNFNFILNAPDGWYYFRALNKETGDTSAVSRIYFDRVKPNLSVKIDGSSVPSGATTNFQTAKITLTGQDEGSGISKYFYKKNNGNFTSCSAGVVFEEEGNYSFYTEDRAGNISDIVYITKDTSAPLTTIQNNLTQALLEDNSIVSTSSIKLTATDITSDIEALYINYNNLGYTRYATNEIILENEGSYKFFATDSVGNQSAIKNITIKRTAPSVKIFAGYSELTTGTIVNAPKIKIVTDDSEALCFFKLDGGLYQSCLNNSDFDKEGSYSFYVQDVAGNKSGEFKVYVDRTPPTGNIYINDKKFSGLYTNNDFTYNAEDNNEFEIYVCYPYMDEFLSTTSNMIYSWEGMFTFYAVDIAGNKSSEKTITLDYTEPDLFIKDADNRYLNGKTYISSPYITIEASDFVSGLDNCYVKLPNSTEYKICAFNSRFYDDGEYSFYAVDLAGNVTSVYTIILDKSLPKGAILSNEIYYNNGSYINQPFKYVILEDTSSGIKKTEIKRPGLDWETYTDEVIQADSENGLYMFRSYTKSDNLSDEISVFFDTIKPTIQFFVDGLPIESNCNIASSNIELVLSDDNADKIYIKYPNTYNFITLAENYYFIDGSYEFFAIDKALNQSELYCLKIDTTSPFGLVYVEGVSINNGAYINKDFYFYATDDICSIAKCEIKIPNGDWADYMQGTVIAASSVNGWYYFRAYDSANNVSKEVKVFLDTIVPMQQLFSGETILLNTKFTNALRINFKAYDDNLDSCYVKLPGTEIFVPTSSGAIYSEEGYYEFYAVDKAGNNTEICNITIDRMPKPVTFDSIENNVALDDVVISWIDLQGLAPILSVTVNGRHYKKGNVLKTINNGVYNVISIDTAGNEWQYAFSSSRADIQTITYKEHWWETQDNNNFTYSFESFNNAFNFSLERELSLVEARIWNNETWDAGIAMDLKDAENAKLGTFYVYKKHDNPNILVAYFTLSRLEEVAKKYSEESIQKWYYWQKTPSATYGNNNLTYNSQNYIVTNQLELKSHANYLINGVRYDNMTLDEQGDYKITVFDDWGNSYAYRIVIVKEPPSLYFRIENGDYYKATNEQPYYFKNRITVKIIDLLDEFAMSIIKNSSNEVIKLFNLKEEIILNDSGIYFIQVINHSGISQEFAFCISKNLPLVNVIPDDIAKKFSVSFIPSIDKDINIESIKILKSLDNLDWSELLEDDYGMAVTKERLSYNFYSSGYYRFEIEDTCRTGIDKICYEFYYNKPQPQGYLFGVSENGHTNSEVSFSWSDEAYATIKTGEAEPTGYTSGATITNEGEYKITLYDYDTHAIEYNFVIDKTPIVTTISGQSTNGFYKGSVSVNWDEQSAIALVYFNGDCIGEYTKGRELSDDGSYLINICDLANNSTVVEFTIKNSPPTIDLIGVKNGGSTTGKVMATNLSEYSSMQVYHNGVAVPYNIGDILTKTGSYNIVLTDEAGNVNEFKFDIKYSLNSSSIMIILITIAALISTLAAIVILRKRKLFKAKKA